MVTQFFMAMRPPTCTAQEKQVRVVHGKPQFYEPQALAAARAKLLVAWLRIWSPSPPAHPLGKMTYTNRRPARKSNSHNQNKKRIFRRPQKETDISDPPNRNPHIFERIQQLHNLIKPDCRAQV